MSKRHSNVKADRVKQWKRPSIASTPTPGTLERSFRKDLGQVNPHLALADTAMRRLGAEMSQAADAKSFLRMAVKSHHSRLYTDHLNFKIASALLYLSQIALIISRLDYLCDQLQQHPLVYPKSREIALGDFVRRTLFILLQSRSKDSIAQPLAAEIISLHIDSDGLSLLDYYRRIRNMQLHSYSILFEKSSPGIRQLGDLDLNPASITPSTTPSQPCDINFNDVILCSKAAQNVARGLCCAMIDPTTELPSELIWRFGNLSPVRRNHAALGFLSQEFLLDEAAAKAILSSMSWLA